MKNIFKTAVVFFALTASALASNEYVLEIKDHKFTPEIVEVKAGEEFTLIVKNLDKTVEEFESHDLRAEKIISGGKTAKIKVGALKAGEYKFFGEFHSKTAIGKVVVK